MWEAHTKTSVIWILALFATAGRAAEPMHFEKRVLADDLAGGYQVIACDVNGDGKPDLIALASRMADLVWFENPSWERYVLAANLPRMINVACWNQGPHAPPTIAVAYEFSMDPEKSAGIVALLRPDGDPRSPWKATEIDRLPASHRLRWANIDGSGNKVLINAPLAAAHARAPEYREHVPLVYYRPGEWKRRLIGNAEEGVMHGIFITDWNHDGRDAILIGSFLGIHLYSFESDGKWSRREITKGNPKAWPKSGTSDVAVGRLGNERFLAAIEPWHGNEVVVYRGSGQSWKREVIDDSLSDAHTVETVDLDGDGRDEIVAGFRGKPYGVYIYRLKGAKWKREILDSGSISAAGCAVADLDGDGKPEIACIGQATHNLSLWHLRP
jgi:FG-GAP-like repeat/FG-GAP repeat